MDSSGRTALPAVGDDGRSDHQRSPRHHGCEPRDPIVRLDAGTPEPGAPGSTVATCFSDFAQGLSEMTSNDSVGFDSGPGRQPLRTVNDASPRHHPCTCRDGGRSRWTAASRPDRFGVDLGAIATGSVGLRSRRYAWPGSVGPGASSLSGVARRISGRKTGGGKSRQPEESVSPRTPSRSVRSCRSPM